MSTEGQTGCREYEANRCSCVRKVAGGGRVASPNALGMLAAEGAGCQGMEARAGCDEHRGQTWCHEYEANRCSCVRWSQEGRVASPPMSSSVLAAERGRVPRARKARAWCEKHERPDRLP